MSLLNSDERRPKFCISVSLRSLHLPIAKYRNTADSNVAASRADLESHRDASIGKHWINLEIITLDDDPHAIWMTPYHQVSCFCGMIM
jgi:hypothetical protein